MFISEIESLKCKYKEEGTSGLYMQNSTNVPNSGFTSAKYKGQNHRKYNTHFRKKARF